MDKVSIQFYDDREVRAVWDDENNKWWFSVLDIIAVLRDVDDYEKNRNYWKYLKAKLKREGNQLGSVTTQFKFTAPDGKRHAANVLDHDGIIELARNFPAKQANRFIEWFTYSDETIDGKSRMTAVTHGDCAYRQALAARLTETDVIGIVPDGIFPGYCSSLFPGMEISDFMNLPYEEEEVQMMLPEITWIPEREQKLIGQL